MTVAFSLRIAGADEWDFPADLYGGHLSQRIITNIENGVFIWIFLQFKMFYY